MYAKITVCAAAALLLSGSAALAQATADERADRSASIHNTQQARADSALLQKDNAEISRLKHKAAHEHGAQRDADLAEAQHYTELAQEVRNRLKGISAEDRTLNKDYHSDLAGKPPH